MNSDSVSLGFTEGRFPKGMHVCQVFSDDAERDRVLSQFVCAGLQHGERCACFSDHANLTTLLAQLDEQGVDLAQANRSGALTMARTSDAYFANGTFEPERMLNQLELFHRDALAQGYPAARLIGEMTNQIEAVPGGSRLLEYETRVSLLLREHPIATVCQYDARTFDGASIMDILRVHPFLLVRGAVVENPFYLDPETFLREMSGDA